ncbi:MAG: LamG domain-containing protein [Muribaculaceae bacterium]|nr:LamG domain-containing protein [Muribaculaceae bacterium]
MDPPAGNQIYPSLQNVGSYNFDEELDPLLVELASHSGGTPATVAVDDSVQSPILDISQGTYARLANPLSAVVCQTSASVSLWYKQVSDQALEEGVVAPLNATSSMLHWENEGSTLDLTANGSLKFKSGAETVTIDPETALNDFIKSDKWQFITYVVMKNGYKMYVGGEEMPIAVPEGTDLSEAVALMNHAESVVLNSDGDQHMLVDDVTFFRNSATEKEAKQPKKGKIGQTAGPGVTVGEPLPDPVFFYNFERGTGDATIVGGGEIVDAGGNFGKVFQNAKGGMRQNYLQLPDDVFVKAGGNEEITISLWVNAKNAGESGEYGWCPMFTAYDSNVAGTGCPMFACQYRGTVQVNCNGNDNAGDAWCDYTDEQHDQGHATLYHFDNDWLADKDWHFYTAVITKTTAAVYFDGELANSWTIDGVNRGGRCEIFGDSRFDLFCVGGMQAWNWGDPDPAFMFDDVAIYDHALSKEQIQTLINLKENVPSPIYTYNFENGTGDAQIVGAGTIENAGGNWGKVFQNAKGGMRQNYLQLPDDVFVQAGGNDEITISLWVNAKNAGESGEYGWCPMFTAYDGNVAGTGCPMFACQYRGTVQVNCNGNDNAGDAWCDYTDEQHDQGHATLYHFDNDWLADKDWHFYTAVITKTTAAVYFDGELANSWTIDGVSRGGRCEMFGDSRFNLFCVGGMQAWNWGDPDPAFMFNNVEIYNKALTPEQIKTLIGLKQ